MPCESRRKSVFDYVTRLAVSFPDVFFFFFFSIFPNWSILRIVIQFKIGLNLDTDPAVDSSPFDCKKKNNI